MTADAPITDEELAAMERDFCFPFIPSTGSIVFEQWRRHATRLVTAFRAERARAEKADKEAATAASEQLRLIGEAKWWQDRYHAIYKLSCEDHNRANEAESRIAALEAERTKLDVQLAEAHETIAGLVHESGAMVKPYIVENSITAFKARAALEERK